MHQHQPLISSCGMALPLPSPFPASSTRVSTTSAVKNDKRLERYTTIPHSNLAAHGPDAPTAVSRYRATTASTCHHSILLYHVRRHMSHARGTACPMPLTHASPRAPPLPPLTRQNVPTSLPPPRFICTHLALSYIIPTSLILLLFHQILHHLVFTHTPITDGHT